MSLEIKTLDHAVLKFNNAYQKIIKTKPIDVKSSKYIEFDVEK